MDYIKELITIVLFLSLEKRNYVNKTVSKLVTDDGIVPSRHFEWNWMIL